MPIKNLEAPETQSYAASTTNLDEQAFSNVASVFIKQKKNSLKGFSRKEKKAYKQALKADLKELEQKSRDLKQQRKQLEKTRSKSFKDALAAVKVDTEDVTKKTAAARKRTSDAQNVYDLLGFKYMYKNGICEIVDGLFTQTLAFEDISYQSSSEEDQIKIHEQMSALLDYYTEDCALQYSVSNIALRKDQLGHQAFFDVKDESLKPLAQTYNDILNQKVLEGVSNMYRTRLLTIATQAESIDEATRKLARLMSYAKQQLKNLGSSTHVLSGVEYLQEISHITRPEYDYHFDYKNLMSSKFLTAKDSVCPSILDFKTDSLARRYYSDGKCCQVLFIRENFAARLTDQCISSMLDLDFPVTVSWHLQPQDYSTSVAQARRTASWLQSEIVTQQQQALSKGYDTSILPAALRENMSNSEEVLDLLEGKGQRQYIFAGVVFTYAQDDETLDRRISEIKRAAHARGLEVSEAQYQQQECLNTVLPLCNNQSNCYRDLTTFQAALMMPFTTQEIVHEGGGYYGQNQTSHNLVLVRRRNLMSPHGFVCGMSGSGKSFAIKREIFNTFLVDPTAEVFINDVTGEYSYLVNTLNQTEYEFSPDSKIFINPFDMQVSSELSAPTALSWKTDAICAMLSAMKSEGKEGLTQIERSLITAAVERCYQQKPDDVPILEDLVYNLQNSSAEVATKQSQELALILTRYTQGASSFLNHKTTKTPATRLVSYNTSKVSADMRAFVMLANLEDQRQRILYNHAQGINTYIYIDEIQSLFAHQTVLVYLARLWREIRKFGGIMTGMTQSVTALAQASESNSDARDIVKQSGFYLLLKQSAEDAAYWQAAKGLSDSELRVIGDVCQPGQGLLIADGARVAVEDDFPRNNILWDMFNTSPEEYAARKKVS